MKLKVVRGLSSSFRGLLPAFLSDLLPPFSGLYSGADKSLARSGRKQANIAVRMA